MTCFCELNAKVEEQRVVFWKKMQHYSIDRSSQELLVSFCVSQVCRVTGHVHDARELRLATSFLCGT